MPNHVHLLILPKNGEDIPQILMTLKKGVTEKAVKWLKSNNPDGLKSMMDLQPNGLQSLRFWQRGGGYDRNIFSAEEANEKLRYIHTNPVRAKLANTEEEWKWSSYHAWETDTNSPLPIDKASFPVILR